MDWVITKARNKHMDSFLIFGGDLAKQFSCLYIYICFFIIIIIAFHMSQNIKTILNFNYGKKIESKEMIHAQVNFFLLAVLG